MRFSAIKSQHSMRRLLLLAAFLPAFVSAAAQDYGVPGFDSIAGNPAAYRSCIDRFVKAEERLTADECFIVYFGFARQAYYTGDLVAGEKELQESILAGDMELAYELGNRVLSRNPVNLTALYWTLAAAVETKKPWEIRNSLRARYNNVTVAISRSGNGLTQETAFRIICTGDMYTYCMAELDVEIRDRYLWDGRYDMLEVKPTAKFPEGEVWFDSSLPNGKNGNKED